MPSTSARRRDDTAPDCCGRSHRDPRKPGFLVLHLARRPRSPLKSARAPGPRGSRPRRAPPGRRPAGRRAQTCDVRIAGRRAAPRRPAGRTLQEQGLLPGRRRIGRRGWRGRQASPAGSRRTFSATRAASGSSPGSESSRTSTAVAPAGEEPGRRRRWRRRLEAKSRDGSAGGAQRHEPNSHHEHRNNKSQGRSLRITDSHTISSTDQHLVVEDTNELVAAPS